MSWIYEQRTGRLTSPAGAVLCCGYAGHGEGKNNPEMERVPNVGPLPRGKYSIGPSFDHERKGPVCMRLTPVHGVEVYGRAGFMIHGDSRSAPGSASEGCIILARMVRLEIAASNDRVLEVVSGD